jgi:hypothetical protein
MACGYGACWGCAVEIDGELKRLCVEGPVLDSWPAAARAGRSPAPPPPHAADGAVLSGPVPVSTVPSGTTPPAARQEPRR